MPRKEQLKFEITPVSIFYYYRQSQSVTPVFCNVTTKHSRRAPCYASDFHHWRTSFISQDTAARRCAPLEPQYEPHGQLSILAFNSEIISRGLK